MVQEQHAIYFGYAAFRRFSVILQESKGVKFTPEVYVFFTGAPLFSFHLYYWC